MKNRKILFTNKALKNLIIPLVIEQILVMLVGMVDTMMVSHAGEAAISGVANSLRAAGDVRFTMVAGIGSMLLFRLGSGLLFGVILDLGVLGVWMAMGMDWLARSVAFTLRYKSGKWKTFKIINEKETLS